MTWDEQGGEGWCAEKGYIGTSPGSRDIADIRKPKIFTTESRRRLETKPRAGVPHEYLSWLRRKEGPGTRKKFESMHTSA
jgi:hypothetical protein